MHLKSNLYKKDHKEIVKITDFINPIYFGILGAVLCIPLLVMTLIIGVPIWLLCSYIFQRKVYTEFTFKTSDFNTLTKSRLKNEVGDYKPPWWYNTHIGSLIQFGKSPNLKFEREIFTLRDGSVFGVDWYPRKPCGTISENICLYLPGLGQSSDANVSQYFVKTFADECFITGIIIPRGHPTSGIPLVNTKLWNAGRTEDCNFVVESMHKRFTVGGGKAKLFMSGFSASSSIVTKSLIELSNTLPSLFATCNTSNLQVIGAMCCCVNYDYEDNRTKMERTFVGKFYSFLLASINKMLLNANPHIHDKIDNISLHKMKTAYQLSQFDSAAHIINGFNSEKEMYSQISGFPGIQKIPVHFLALLASDDPFYTWSYGNTKSGIDISGYTANPNVMLIETSHGNHFGYYEGSVFQAFANTTSYTYPAKLALVFSKSIIEFEILAINNILRDTNTQCY